METPNGKMEKQLVPMLPNDLYVTNAEFQGCFIKIWTSFYSKKRSNLEKSVQNYRNYSKVPITAIVVIISHDNLLNIYF